MTEAPPIADEDADETWEAEPAELAPDEEASHHAILDDRPVIVSAFAGIGGFDLGFERAGFQTGAVIEWDAAASRVLAARFPNAARFSDVRNVNGESVRRAIGGRQVAVLSGGFPCQDLSVAGRRAGMAGKRSGLYGELLRLAEELDPDWLVVENVPGIFSADADPEANDGEGYGPGTGFALFLGDVTGYRPPVPDGGWRNSGVCSGPIGTCAWRVLDARHFGVAQRRRRMLAVVNTRDRRASAAVLLEPEGMRRDPAPGRPTWARAAATPVGAAVRGRPGGADRDREGGVGAAVVEQVSTLQAGGGEDPHDYSQSTYVAVDEVVPGDTAGGIQQYPDGNVALEPHAPTLTRSQDAKIVDGRPVGHVEAGGGDDVSPTVTSKWAKGSGGPAGSETGNLVAMRESGQGFWTEDDEAATLRIGGDPGTVVTVVGDGGTEVSHPVTASGTDGMGRGVPAVAFRTDQSFDDGIASGVDVAMTLTDRNMAVAPGTAYGISSDAIDCTGEGAAGDAASRAGLGILEEASPTLRTRAQAVAYTPDVAAPLTAGSHSPGVSAPGRRQEDDVNVVAAYRKSRRAQTNEDDETWVEADHANTLNTFDGGDTRATEVVIERAQGVHLTQDPIHGDEFTPAKSGGQGVSVPHASVRRLTPRECERLQGFPPVLLWRTDDMTRDEFCAALLAAGWVTVDVDTGTVYRHRGPGGRLLDQRVEVPGTEVKGYLVATFQLDGERRQVRLNRLVWVAAHGIPEPGLDVCHRDDVKHHNGIGNLYLATGAQNSADAAATGRYRRGEDSGRAVLTNAETLQVCDDYRAGDVTIRQLAERYGVSKSRIGQIVKQRDWTLVLDAKGKPASDSPRYKQLGNAVCCNVAEWLALQIRAYDDGVLG